MIADKPPQFQICLSDAEADAMTWSVANTEQVTTQLERETDAITSNKQKGLIKKFSILLIEFEAWWDSIGIQTLRKTI